MHFQYIRSFAMAYLVVLTLVIAIPIVTLWIYKISMFLKLCAPLREYPCSKKHPVFGHLFDIIVEPDILFKNLRRFSKENPYYVIWAMWVPVLNLTTPEDIEVITSPMKHLGKSDLYNVIKAWLKEGLLTSQGKKWHERRKILTPAFHFNILQQFLNTFTEKSQELVNGLKDECDKPYTAINSIVINFTLQAICETAMGTSCKSEDKDYREYRELIHKFGEISVYLLSRPWSGTVLKFFMATFWDMHITAWKLHKFTKKFIKQREATFKLSEEDITSGYGKNRKLAMLDLLLYNKLNNRNIDDNGILEEVDTFTFEGHDTTAMSIIFTLMLLANHKEAQDRIVEEIYEVLGENTRPTYQHLQDLKYLENCIKESLRIYPSVPLIAREVSDTIQFRQHKLVKGTMISIHIYDLHHNPSLYPDPEKFDPDRFLPENVLGRHPFAYLPFSAGPRNCIGQRFAMLEIKTIILYILRNYELHPVDTPDTIVLMSDFVLRTKDPIKIKLSPRPMNRRK